MAKKIKASKKLGASKKVEEENTSVEENLNPPVEEEKEENPNITADEEETINTQQKEAEKSVEASTEKLRRTTALLSKKFNLDDTYKVSSFDDKGKVVKETLESSEFIVTITVKDSARQGLAVNED